MILNNKDVIRLYECVVCPYYDRCMEEVTDPEDNIDGTCRTKQIFKEKSILS